MERIERYLSRPTAKPYRTRDLEKSGVPYTNEDGHIDFSPNDLENPKNWSAARRWYITVASVFMVVNATFASSAPSACLEGISEDFNVTGEVSNLVVTIFLLGYCLGPLVFAPLSEFYGRRWIFYVTFTVYFAFNFLCAFTPTFAGLLIGRLITGIMASAALSNAPGVLVDIWGPKERGNAMALFSVMTFCGPALGPVITGFLQLKENWRWCFYVLIALGGLTELLMFTIPETLPSIVLVHKAQRIRAAKIPGFENVQAPVEATDRTLASIFKVALTRPWKILVDPISLAVAFYLSVVYALLYMLFTIYPIVFQQKRGWNSGVGELPLLGTVIGAAIGGVIVFISSSQDEKRVRAGHKMTPEDRLPVAMIGGVLFPICMFWFAWTAEYNSVPWIVPTIAGVFLSTAIMLVFVSYLNYLTDTYLMYAASALAANTVCRSICGAAAPLYTEYMFNALGVGGGGSLIGGIAVLLAPIPFIFYKYGGPIRERSKFAPTSPLVAAPQEPVVETKETNAVTEQHNRRSESGTDTTLSDTSSTVSGTHDASITMEGREKIESDDRGAMETAF